MAPYFWVGAKYAITPQLDVTGAYYYQQQSDFNPTACTYGNTTFVQANGNKLVVNAGTALTIDALRDDGTFLGGLIVPGPALMRSALNRNTAGLRLTEGAFEPLPKSTPDAITTGSIQACVGAIERTARALEGQGHAAVHVLLSGGAAGEIAGHLPLAHDIRENLVLEGLALIARAG